MPYSYQERIKRNAQRFGGKDSEQDGVNIETVSYTPIGELAITGLIMSPIMRRPDNDSEAPVDISYDRQWFGVDTSVLGTTEIDPPDTVIFTPILPEVGDLITRSNGEVYEVVPEGRDSPCFQYVNSSRERIIIHTQRR